MKRLMALLGICFASAFAQGNWDSADVGWDDEPAAPATGAVADGNAAPAEALPTPVAVQEDEIPPVPPSPQDHGFVEIAEPAAPSQAAPAPASSAESKTAAAPATAAPAAAQQEGLQWTFTGNANAAAPAAVPAAQDGDSFVPFGSQPAVNSTSSVPANDDRKKFFAGVFAAGTYNDFYDTKLGFGSLGKSASGYSIKTSGADDILGNFWGLGYNAGLSVLYMPSEFAGVHVEVGGAYRYASSEADISVILTWDDSDRLPEKSDMTIEYYVKQLRIDVPVLAGFALPNVAFLEVGPQASFALYSKSKTVIEDDFGKQTFRKHDVSDVLEMDAVIGVGSTKYIGTKALDMSLRFVMGITALNDADDAPKTWQGQFNLTFWFL